MSLPPEMYLTVCLHIAYALCVLVSKIVEFKKHSPDVFIARVAFCSRKGVTNEARIAICEFKEAQRDDTYSIFRVKRKQSPFVSECKPVSGNTVVCTHLH